MKNINESAYVTSSYPLTLLFTDLLGNVATQNVLNNLFSIEHVTDLSKNFPGRLIGVAVDRFLVISRPMDKKPTRTRAYITVALIWVYAALFAGMPLVGIGKYVPEGYLTSCSFDYLSNDVWTKVFIFIFFVGAWLYPLGVISFCYVAIIWAVYHVRLNVITADGASIATPSEVSKRKRTDISVDTNTTTRRKLRSVVNQPNLELTIAKFVIGLVSMWIIAWTPYALVSLMGISGYQSLLTPFYSMVPALFAKTASCIDPFIYALNHPKIRKEIFCRLYKSFYRAGRDSMTESMRPTYDWKNGRSVTFGQPSRRYSGPSSRRLKSFPFKDDISMSDQRMIQHSAADTDGSEMKTIRDDENSMNLPQPVRKSDGGMLMKYKKRTNSLFLPTMSHKSVINQMSSL